MLYMKIFVEEWKWCDKEWELMVKKKVKEKFIIFIFVVVFLKLNI